MSTYNLKVPEKWSYLLIVEYAKKYTVWKNIAVSSTEHDDDDGVITGEELKDIVRISNFLKIAAFRTVSIMDVVKMLWNVKEFSPDSEGQAKRIVLNEF